MTAEAVFTTFRNALDLLIDCFICNGHCDLSKEIKLKYLTSRLIECFFGYITERIPGNNITFLEWLEESQKMGSAVCCHTLIIQVQE